MKKKEKIRLIAIISVIICTSIILICYDSSGYKTLDKSEETNEVNKKQFAMYIQDSANSDKYSEYTDSNLFPNNLKYSLNVERSECQDYSGSPVDKNGVISVTDDNKIMVTSTKTIFCTFYFDLDKNAPDTPTITSLLGIQDSNNFTVSEGYTHTNKVKVSGSWSDNDIEGYCLTNSNDSSSCEWQKVETQSIENIEHTIENTEGLKTVYLFTRDVAGNVSSIPGSKEITLDTANPTGTVSSTNVTDKGFRVTISDANDSGYAGSGISTYCFKKSSENNWSCGTTTYKDYTASSGVSTTINAKINDNSGRSKLLSDTVVKTYSCSSGTFSNDASKGAICVADATKGESCTPGASTFLGGATGPGCVGCDSRCQSAYPNNTSVYSFDCYSSGSIGACQCYGSQNVCNPTYTCPSGWSEYSGSAATLKCYTKAQ